MTNYYECGHYELVSRRTGSVLEIRTVPEFSPSGRYLISADQNDECERKYDLAIWSTKTDPPSLELRYQARHPPRYAAYLIPSSPRFPYSSGDDHIKLWVFVNGRQGQYDKDAEALRSENGWRLVLGKRVDGRDE